MSDEDGEVSIEPRPIGRRPTMAEPDEAAAGDEDEEIPEWKRALRQLTEEEG
jgi:hypothetical protein